MIPPRPTELAQLLLRDAIRPGDLLIDATAGNGHDCQFLAECAGGHGRVLAFDVQEKAIHSTRARIESAGLAGRVTLVQQCHTRMAEHAAVESVSVIMFNLGYLPGDDHAMTTEAEGTLRALKTAESLLKPGGLLSVICYPGHDAGHAEAQAVEIHLSSLAAATWRIAKYAMLGTLQPAPFLLLARKPCKTTGP